jgi:energy-coupling factor transporter ATP-binding protein EcfA2
MVREHSFVMVVGRSGSGKSSLVNAGLMPALRRDRSQVWDILSLRPGPEPLRALAAVFNPKQENEGLVAYECRIDGEAEGFRTGGPDLLSHVINGALNTAEGKPDRLLLYVDQWEELYAQSPLASNEKPSKQHTADGRFRYLYMPAWFTCRDPLRCSGDLHVGRMRRLLSHWGCQSGRKGGSPPESAAPPLPPRLTQHSRSTAALALAGASELCGNRRSSSRKTRFSSQPILSAHFEEDVALVGLEDDLPLASFAHGPPDTATVIPGGLSRGAAV